MRVFNQIAIALIFKEDEKLVEEAKKNILKMNEI